MPPGEDTKYLAVFPRVDVGVSLEKAYEIQRKNYMAFLNSMEQKVRINLTITVADVMEEDMARFGT